jgi:hypothetical protein
MEYKAGLLRGWIIIISTACDRFQMHCSVLGEGHELVFLREHTSQEFGSQG